MFSGFPLFSGLIVVGCIFGFWFGANWLVESAVRIARRIGVSELIIGLTIVAIGTSAPEFAVSISSAATDQLDISIGNIVGSNIFNVGFILGGLAFFRPVTTSRGLVYRDGFVVILATVMLMVFMWDQYLEWYEGVIFLVLLALYILYLYFRRAAPDEELPEGPFSWTDIPWLLVGLAVVVGSGNYFVEHASIIAQYYGVSDWVIGVTVVAFGTSAPEMATSAVALLRNHSDISAGNLIGSNIFNLFGVLGLAPTIAKGGRMLVDTGAQESTYILLLLMFLVVVLMRTKWQVSRLEGAFLFLFGLVSWILNFSNISIFQILGIT